MRPVIWLTSSLLAIASVSSLQAASPTKVLVRAVARDAKVIGSGVGGARITIKDARSGAVLAQGEQQGGTGDTRLIMYEPRKRGGKVFDTPNSAHFLAELDLDRPTLVDIIAEGPLDTPEYLYRASKSLLVVPSHDILGEGVVLEIHGFRVTLEEAIPETVSTGQRIALRVKVLMA